MIVGIDLGTTNSLVCVWQNGEHKLVKNALGKNSTPSVVGLDDEGRIIVGQIAKDRLLTHPHLTTSLFKRFMGSDADIRLADATYKPQELSAILLKQLITDVEAEFSDKVTEAIITVPAYFNDTQRKMTKLAGRLAGVRVERLLNEPTAAALAYGLSGESDCQILVFDLGGGTFDVSILELYDGIMEVRASAGNNQLGGEDFTSKLMSYFEQTLSDMGAGQELDAKLYSEAERAKCALSNNTEYTAKFNVDTDPIDMTISREKFEALVQPLLEAIHQPVVRALSDTQLSPKEIDHVLLVGGATKMPVISKLVTKMFGIFPNKTLDPDLTVAYGAAIQTGLKVHDEALDEIVLTDVCPFSMGIEISTESGSGQRANGVFSPVLERNLVVPTSRMQTYYTTHDGQEKIAIRVYQGESRQVKNNNYIGFFELNVPPAQAGHESVDVRFSYDTNGLLEVEAIVSSTGNRASSIFSAHSDELSEEQIQNSLDKLSKLKIHPRDETHNAAFLAMADRLYAQNLGDKRERIGQIIDIFKGIVEARSKHEVDEIRKQLEMELKQYEL